MDSESPVYENSIQKMLFSGKAKVISEHIIQFIELKGLLRQSPPAPSSQWQTALYYE
jgi:hypothetical protein